MLWLRTIKKAEHRRIDVFELWCWRRLLRVPWTARRSNQSILKEISPGCSLEGLMLRLKLQYFGHLMRRADSLEKTWCWERLRAGGEGDDRGWDGCMASPTQWTWVWENSGSLWWTRRPGVLQCMGLQRVGHDWVTELNSGRNRDIFWVYIWLSSSEHYMRVTEMFNVPVSIIPRLPWLSGKELFIIKPCLLSNPKTHLGSLKLWVLQS